MDITATFCEKWLQKWLHTESFKTTFTTVRIIDIYFSKVVVVKVVEPKNSTCLITSLMMKYSPHKLVELTFNLT